MGGNTELSGPDLGAGIDAASLNSGDKILGHANGEAVLLARVGDDYFAVGATCTHYGGPLAEGVIDGQTVRCPWHHACFSLRSGEALRSPALSPIACWLTERRGTKIVVSGKVERDPLAPTFPIARTDGDEPRAIVIVGVGAAGSAAAEMLRRCGYEGRVTTIDADPDAPYDRPNLSKDYLAGNAPEEWIPLRPTGFYAEHGIEVVRGRVTKIDTTAKRIEIEGMSPILYDRLLLATGAEPVHLDMPGADLPFVHYLRTLADSRSIIEAAKTAKGAVVIGSSFIGLEVAASLRARKLDVHVVAPEQIPLGRVLGDYLGGFIRSLHEEKGVVFHLGHTSKRIEQGAVVLDDDSRLALGPCPASGAGRRAQHAWRARALRSGAVFLERALRHQHQLRWSRGKAGSRRRGRRCGQARRRGETGKRRGAARARHALPRRGQLASGAGHGTRGRSTQPDRPPAIK